VETNAIQETQVRILPVRHFCNSEKNWTISFRERITKVERQGNSCRVPQEQFSELDFVPTKI